MPLTVCSSYNSTLYASYNPMNLGCISDSIIASYQPDSLVDTTIINMTNVYLWQWDKYLKKIVRGHWLIIIIMSSQIKIIYIFQLNIYVFRVFNTLTWVDKDRIYFSEYGTHLHKVCLIDAGKIKISDQLMFADLIKNR